MFSYKHSLGCLDGDGSTGSSLQRNTSSTLIFLTRSLPNLVNS